MLVVAQGLTRPATRVSRTGALVSLAPKTQCARRFASIAQIQTTTKDPASAEVADLRKVLRAYRLETGGTKQELLDRIASVAKIEDPCEVDFHTELAYLDVQVPFVKLDELEKAQVAVKRAKSMEKKPLAIDCETIFYYFAKKKDADRMIVAYYDHKAVSPSPVLMLQLMMVYAGKLSDLQLAKSVIDELRALKHYKWPEVTIEACLKTWALLGHMETLLEIYNKLYEHGNLPQKLHWAMMLKGAARAGDPKHFARFYHRLTIKGHTLHAPHLKQVLLEWGMHDDANWRKSSACNTQVLDYVFMVDIAQRGRNYKLAIQLLDDVLQLDKQPTAQLYEMFISGVQRDIPRFFTSGRELKLRWKETFGSVDKATIERMHQWITEIVEFVGPDNLVDLPPQEYAPKPKVKQTRKQRAYDMGYAQERVRYISKHSDPNRLFEYVPHYLRRLEREKNEQERLKKKENMKDKIEEEIKRAEQRKKAWHGMGFQGNYPVDPSDSVYEILEARLIEIKEYLREDVSVYPGRDPDVEFEQEAYKDGEDAEYREFKEEDEIVDQEADEIVLDDEEIDKAVDEIYEDVDEVADEGPDENVDEGLAENEDEGLAENVDEEPTTDVTIDETPIFSDHFQEIFMEEEEKREEPEHIVAEKLRAEEIKERSMEPEKNTGF